VCQSSTHGEEEFSRGGSRNYFVSFITKKIKGQIVYDAQTTVPASEISGAKTIYVYETPEWEVVGVYIRTQNNVQKEELCTDSAYKCGVW